MSDALVVQQSALAPNVRRAADGTVTAAVNIVLTPAQWQKLLGHHQLRAVFCGIEMDVPQLADFVLHQIFTQIMQGTNGSSNNGN